MKCVGCGVQGVEAYLLDGVKAHQVRHAVHEQALYLLHDLDILVIVKHWCSKFHWKEPLSKSPLRGEVGTFFTA